MTNEQEIARLHGRTAENLKALLHLETLRQQLLEKAAQKSDERLKESLKLNAQTSAAVRETLELARARLTELEAIVRMRKKTPAILPIPNDPAADP